MQLTINIDPVTQKRLSRIAQLMPGEHTTDNLLAIAIAGLWVSQEQQANARTRMHLAEIAHQLNR